MKQVKWPLAGLAIMLVTSCAKTTIFPEGGDTFSSISTSSDQGYAERDAQRKADAYCKKLGKNLAVIKHETEYHGTTTQNRIIGGVVSGLVGGGNPAVSDNDYEVKMRFRCQ